MMAVDGMAWMASTVPVSLPACNLEENGSDGMGNYPSDLSIHP